MSDFEEIRCTLERCQFFPLWLREGSCIERSLCITSCTLWYSSYDSLVCRVDDIHELAPLRVHPFSIDVHLVAEYLRGRTRLGLRLCWHTSIIREFSLANKLDTEMPHN